MTMAPSYTESRWGFWEGRGPSTPQDDALSASSCYAQDDTAWFCNRNGIRIFRAENLVSVSEGNATG